MLQEPSNLAVPLPAPLPDAVLEGLYPFSRAAHGCLMLLDAQGRLVRFDAGAGEFFEKFLAPSLLQLPETASRMKERLATLGTHSPVQFWDTLPGVMIAAAPIVDRRQVVGALVLAGRREGFALDDELASMAAQLGVDPVQLVKQAAALPARSRADLCRDGAMLAGLLVDRLRVASLELELDSLSTQLANTYEELALIDRVSGGMRVNRSAVDFFQQACLDVMPVINVRGVGYSLCHERVRQAPALFGEVELAPVDLRRLTDQLIAAVLLRKGAIVINDVASDPRFAFLAPAARQLVAVPMQRRDVMLGTLFALDKCAGEFVSVDAKLLTSIANESSIYLENAMLFGDVHDLMMGLLHSLTSAVDAKDAYTCGHSERVALLSRHLATAISLPDAEVERVYMAGLLHDVGKIGVPEAVLQKTGKLTAEEFEQIKKHPQIGARILADVKQLEDIIPGVLYHHERFDGRGYPAGLAGRDIPLMGRLICVADCFDAMTSSRTYRRALPLEVALTEIRRCAGTQFDPALAEVFLRISPDQLASLLSDHQRKAKRLLELQETLRAA